jgi:thiamine biosynthesis protein ThiS
MRIQVNSEVREAAEGMTIADLLREMSLDARRVAVERNRKLAPRDQHEETTLADGDQLEIVTLVGGG